MHGAKLGELPLRAELLELLVTCAVFGVGRARAIEVDDFALQSVDDLPLGVELLLQGGGVVELAPQARDFLGLSVGMRVRRSELEEQSVSILVEREDAGAQLEESVVLRFRAHDLFVEKPRAGRGVADRRHEDADLREERVELGGRQKVSVGVRGKTLMLRELPERGVARHQKDLRTLGVRIGLDPIAKAEAVHSWELGRHQDQREIVRSGAGEPLDSIAERDDVAAEIGQRFGEPRRGRNVDIHEKNTHHWQAGLTPVHVPASQQTPASQVRAPEQSTAQVVPLHVMGCVQESGFVHWMSHDAAEQAIDPVHVPAA